MHPAAFTLFLLPLFAGPSKLQSCSQASFTPSQRPPSPPSLPDFLRTTRSRSIAGFTLAIAGIIAALTAFQPRLPFLGLPSPHSGGRWVRDRTLGGRQVFIPEGQSIPNSPSSSTPPSPLAAPASRSESPAPSLNPAPPSSRAASDEEPAWWNPEPSRFRPESQRRDAADRARRCLKRLVDEKLAGRDFPVEGIIQLRDACSEAGEPVHVGYSNRRDAIFRAGVEAALQCAENAEQIGGTQASRFVTALAHDLQVPQQRAANIVAASQASTLRSRVLDAVASMRQGNSANAMLSLQSVENAFSAIPQKAEQSAELEMVADSLAERVHSEEKAKVLQLYSSDVTSSEKQGHARDALSLALR